MPLPRSQLRSSGMRGRVSVKSRIGFNTGTAKKTGIQARLGAGVVADARLKINLQRTQFGRVGKTNDAREKIEARRMTTGRNTKSRNPSFGQQSASPLKNLIITATNTTPSPSGPTGLFRSAVSGMGQWGYVPPPVQQVNRSSPPVMLTRTIANPMARHNPQQFSAQKTNFQGSLAASAAVAKVAPSFGLNRARFTHDARSSRDEDMEIDRPSPIRSSMQSRLDTPKFKIRISNLKSSVTLDDIMELFADVGDLTSAKMISSGTAEAYFKSKGDCLNAVEVYHNRLLDGSPMKVTVENEAVAPAIAAGKRVPALKSASGATIPLPKSASSIKIHPDLSAIHKVLFQPSSSSNAAKMLFKGVGQ